MRRALAPLVLARALAALAGVVLALALLVIGLRTGSFWPWSLIVHEDGQRTLTATILYFEHATRELPLDVLLGVAIGGSVAFAYPPPDQPARSSDRRLATLALASVIVVAVILVGAAIQGGPQVMLANLLQQHTRPGQPLVWGGHWRYHLGSRLALMLIAFGLAGLVRLITDRGRAGGGGRGLVVVGSALALFAALTILFANSWSSVQLVFQDPIALGHQARELSTHALVTVPLGWAGCLLSVRAARTGAPEPPWGPGRATPGVVVALLMGATGALLAAYLGVAALLADAVSHGQTGDLAMLLFPHFFEHSFTYLVVPTVAALVYELVVSRARA